MPQAIPGPNIGYDFEKASPMMYITQLHTEPATMAISTKLVTKLLNISGRTVKPQHQRSRENGGANNERFTFLCSISFIKPAIFLSMYEFIPNELKNKSTVRYRTL